MTLSASADNSAETGAVDADTIARNELAENTGVRSIGIV